jgi:hypothetical protein
MARVIGSTIQDLEYQLAKCKAVQAKFPLARVNCHSEYQSKEVNQNYTKFEFEVREKGKELHVLPYCEVEFTYAGKTEIIRVHSMPKANRLVYIKWNIDLKSYVMNFSRLSINLKNNEFREDMLNSCRAQIMSFIKNNPGYKLNDRHLEPRLKKLLVFT